MVTIKQVAKHAGVSSATVSRVLNDHPSVDQALRQRVLASVTALNYQPSAVARSLRRRETHTIGLVVPDNRNPFFAEIASSIEEYCYGAGYSVYLCNSANDKDKELEYCHNLYEQRVAGVIMSITGISAEGIEYLQNKSMPVVLLDRSYPNIQANVVQCDHYSGARAAMEYLLQLGHRRFGLIMEPQWDPPIRDRLQACIDVLHEHNLQLDPALTYETTGQYDGGYAGARHFFSAPTPPSAIFGFNDTIAIGALHYALEHRIDVPGALSIVGVDNIPISSFVSPRLTTVAQPLTDLGRTAAELLLNWVKGSSGELNGDIQRRVLPTQLIVRESTGPVKA